MGEALKFPEGQEAAKYPEIASELLAMLDTDQQMRTRVHEGGEWGANVDEHNTGRLKDIVAQIGWPTISKVGKDASHAAWLLAQHADHNPSFQQHCLQLLKELPKDEIQPREIGYLEDRVRVADGIPQLYGTQFYVNEEGIFGPRPIEDPEHLQERRDSLHMGSFEGYAKGLIEVNKGYLESQKGSDS